MHIPDQESRGHITPLKTYLLVFVGLLALTGITFLASFVNWGGMIGGGFIMNVFVAMVVATGKAYLVLWYFMHMKYEDKFVWMYGIWYPLILLAILIGISVIDVFMRDVVPPWGVFTDQFFSLTDVFK